MEIDEDESIEDKVIALLTAHPEDVRIRNKWTDGCTALQSAILGGNYDILQYIVSTYNGSLHSSSLLLLEKDYGGRCAIHYLARRPSLRVWKLLVDALSHNHHDLPSSSSSAAAAAAVAATTTTIDADDAISKKTKIKTIPTNQLTMKKKQLAAELADLFDHEHKCIKQGWMRKKLAGYAYTTRWVVLTGSSLAYYVDSHKSSRAPKMTFSLKDSKIDRVLDSYEPTLIITSDYLTSYLGFLDSRNNGRHSMYFVASTEAELQEWLLLIKAVACVSSSSTSDVFAMQTSTSSNIATEAAGTDTDNNFPVCYIPNEYRKRWVASIDSDEDTALHVLMRQETTSGNRSMKSEIDTRRSNITASPSSSLSSLSSSLAPPQPPIDIIRLEVDIFKLTGWLIESGCSVNAQNSSGQTPLHIAIHAFIYNATTSLDVPNSWFEFHRHLVYYLLYKGADAVYTLDNDGLSVLELLSKQSSQLDNIIIMDHVARLHDILHSSSSFKTSVSLSAMRRLTGYSYLSLVFTEG
jgi:ankyrin repeat protein